MLFQNGEFYVYCYSVMSNTAALLRTVKSSWEIVCSAQTVTITRGPCAEHIQSVHLTITWGHNALQFVLSVRCVHLIITSGHNALRFVQFVRSIDIRSVHLIITSGHKCDTVCSIRMVRTARKAHSSCNNPHSINHKPTQAKKPRKVHSKCNISQAINHKPTQVQKPRKTNYIPTQAQNHTFLNKP